MINSIREFTSKNDLISLKTACYTVFPLCFAAQIQAATIAPGPSSGFAYIPQAEESADMVSLGGDDLENILGGISTQVAVSTGYNSNIGQTGTSPILDDVISTLSGTVSYLSKATALTFGGFYRGSYNNYFENSDFSAYNQGGGLVVNYQGGRLTSSFRAGVDYDEGSNRNYFSAVVQRVNYYSNFNARYSLSSKTIIQGNYDYSLSTVSGGAFQDTESYSMGLSALWKYSALTEFGPGVRYTYRSGNSDNGRSSVGPTLNVNYKLSQKVSITSRFGVDFSSYDSGESADPTFSTSIAANYRASALWGMNLSLYRDTQADPSVAGSFTEVTSARLGYNRKIRRATFNTGISYELNRVDNSGAGGGVDRDYLSLDASIGMPIFADKYYSSIYVRYNDQSSDLASQTWDAFQTGITLSRSF